MGGFYNLDGWTSYLIGINFFGLAFFTLAIFLGVLAKKGIEKILLLLAIAGGSFGILLGILLFKRKASKETMMITIFTACVCILQLIAFFLFKDQQWENLSFDFIGWMKSNHYLMLYLLLINILTFIVYGLDKYFALKQKSRIKVSTLILFAAAGGSIGGLLGMYVFRHKIRKDYFVIGLPLILITQILFLFWLMNR